MGTDIHLWVERRLKNGAWAPVNAEPEQPDAAWDGWGMWVDLPSALETLVEGIDKDNFQPTCAIRWNFGRYYECFAVLADVRNYNGISCWNLDVDFPDDLSDKVAACTYDDMGDMDINYHTPGHATLEKLIQCDKMCSDTPERIRELISELQKIKGTYGLRSQDVRIIFCFDN